MPRTRTTVAIDDDALREAMQVLGTTTKLDTVNRALRQVADTGRLARLLDDLDTMSDIDDPQTMQGAWR